MTHDLPGDFDRIPEQGSPFPFDSSGTRRWDAGRAILFFILSGFASMLLSVVLFLPLGFYASIVLAEFFAFGALTVAVSVVFSTGWQSWAAKSSMSGLAWLWAILSVVAFAVAQSNLPVLFDRIYPIPSSQLLIFKEYLTARSPLEMLRLFAVAALAPAVFEELAFRGVIQSGLKETYGARHAVVWTGFLFAILHLNPWNFVGLWSFGCLMGYLVERTGSIRPAMVLHFLNNSIALAVYAIQGREQWDERPEFIAWYWTLIAGIVLIVAIRELHRHTASRSMPPMVGPNMAPPFDDLPSG